MQESFLHFLWKYRRFDHKDLQTTEGQAIHIHKTGTHNTDAGPDFFEARIQIGDTLWAGNVEIHLQASDWLQHGHQTDAAYENVILHVVLEEDKPIFRASGERIPCLELRKRIPAKLLATYQKIEHNRYWIPCQHHFHSIDDFVKQNWLDRLLVERLASKTHAIERALAQQRQDWETVFYQFLARNFGTKVNADAFEQLARALPYRTLFKHKDNLLQMEALLFGQAGLLDRTFTDEYPQTLQREYQHLRHKYQLSPIATTNWKMLRMRPANLPTIRIAQLAQLLFQSNHLFSKMLVAQNIKEIENMFALQLSNYWQTHYVFDKKTTKRNKRLGKSTIHLLIINTIVPFLFAYARAKGDENHQGRALQLLESLPPEKNALIRKWASLGQTAAHAAHTQALLQLKNAYCTPKRCLHCAIGNAILK